MKFMKRMPTTQRLKPSARRVWAHCASAALVAIVLVGACDALAQGSTMQAGPNAMQGFSQNRDKPIQIDAGSLELRDKDKAATFKDNVKVVQGDTTMRCKILVVYYDGGANSGGNSQPKPTMTSATPGPTGSSSIKRLEAKGGVIVTQKDQTVTGDTGEFDMRSNTITMNGNVVMTQADKVLRGDKLIVDMTTGVSRVEVKSGGRVQMLIPNAGKAAGPGGLIPGSGEPPAPAAKSNSPGKPTNLNDLTGSGKR